MKLIAPGYIYCPVCSSKLSTSIMSSALVTMAVAAPVAFSVNMILQGADVERGTKVIAAIIASVFISHLLSPLKLLAQVK